MAIPTLVKSLTEIKAEVKASYEANADTNAFTDDNKTTVGNSKLRLPSRAQFEALAAKLRSDYPGSGFLEWGNSNVSWLTNTVNQGLWGSTAVANQFRLGRGATPTGTSKSNFPIVVSNGYRSAVRDSGVTDTDLNNIIQFPDAPATAALLDRQDLVFFEQWHEDISEKGIVYPYGSTQYNKSTYTAPDGTTITCANGAFSGYDTYSLFGNWQSAGALIGKGIVWSTMTDAQKKAFCADPGNNMYLDGSTVVQVRYRIRVVQGLGSAWDGSHFDVGISTFRYNSSNSILPKGKQTSISADFTSAGPYYYLPSSTQAVALNANTPGTYVGSNFSGANTSIGYNGKCLAIPICLVQRRNQGAYHPVFNPNGCAYVNKTVASGKFYEANFILFASTADAFNFVPATDTVTPGANANTGYISSNLSGRPDGLYYDAIYESDVKDLRMSAREVTDLKRTLEREFNRLVANTTRGWESGRGMMSAYDIKLVPRGLYYSTSNNCVIYQDTWMTKMSLFAVGDAITVIYKGEVYNSTIAGIANNYINFASAELKAAFAVDFPADAGFDFVDIPFIISRTAAKPLYKSLPYSYRQTLQCDIIGDPANYPSSWLTNGVAGTPLLVDESGNSLIPDGTAKTYKLSRKVASAKLYLQSSDGGATWISNTSFSGASATWSDSANAFVSKAFAAGDIVLCFYLTDASSLESAANSEVLALGDVWASNHQYLSQGCKTVESLIGKVPTSYDTGKAALLTAVMDYNSQKLSTTSFGPTHTTPSMMADVTTSPTVKVLPLFTRSSGMLFLQLVYKEMVYNGSSWGDDNKFSIIDNDSTTTDLNGKTSRIGQKRCIFPIGFIRDSA